MDIRAAGLDHSEYDHALCVPFAAMVFDEGIIEGSYLGSCVSAREVPPWLSLIRRRLLPVERLKCGEIGCDSLHPGFDRLEDGDAVSQILRPTEPPQRPQPAAL